MTPKWPGDHSAKHSAAARKGWATRRGTAAPKAAPAAIESHASRIRTLEDAIRAHTDEIRRVSDPRYGMPADRRAQAVERLRGLIRRDETLLKAARRGTAAPAKAAPAKPAAKPRAAAKGGSMTYEQWKAHYVAYTQGKASGVDMHSHFAKHPRFAARYRSERGTAAPKAAPKAAAPTKPRAAAKGRMTYEQYKARMDYLLSRPGGVGTGDAYDLRLHHPQFGARHRRERGGV